MPRRRTTTKTKTDKSTSSSSSPINMKPVSLRFTGPQMDRLRGEVKKTGLAMTEIIRRAVDDYLHAA